MNDYEQLENIKTWWKTYGKRTIFGLLFVVVAILGWKQWQEKKEADAARASDAYEALLVSVTKQDKTAIKAQTQYILEHFPKSIYAAFTQLMLAKQAVLDHKLSDAALILEKARALLKNSPLRLLAEYRLARVYLAGGSPQKALTVLSTENPGAYQALFDEVKGDCYLAQGKIKQAKEAYQLALNSPFVEKKEHSFLQMKLESLGQ